jgi:tRNA (cmo5U34)-methyltransferase
VDFDTRPPVPVPEYEATVKRTNAGYDLLFTLTGCFLNALDQPDLDLLVVGAGGGAEIERFLPEHPGWRLTGVDPSRDMLALAQAKAERLGVAERVTLVRGTVDDLPDTARFDAATCMYVLHFLPEDGKLALLQGVARRRLPGGLALVAAGVRRDFDGLQDDIGGAWQQYAKRMGLSAEQMAAFMARQKETPPDGATEEDYPRLLREAGFRRVTRYFNALGGMGWLAR